MRRIIFKEKTSFLGRNGYFKQSGIDITEGPDCVFIHPITSRGLIGRATISIPKEHIEEFAVQLLLTLIDEQTIHP